jgi:hypothetical protein
METQEFFKKWQSDSPKSFDKFEKYLKKYNLMFEMLIGIINKFYCENGIIIIENYDRETKKYLKTIFSGINLENEIDINDDENYKKINYDCFLYAAEILEKELS